MVRLPTVSMENVGRPFACKGVIGVLLIAFLFHAFVCDAETFGHSRGAISSKEMSITQWEVPQPPTADSPHDAEGHYGEQSFGCLVYESSPIADGVLWSGAPLVVKVTPRYRPLFDRSLFNPPKPLSV